MVQEASARVLGTWRREERRGRWRWIGEGDGDGEKKKIEEGWPRRWPEASAYVDEEEGRR